MAEAPPPPPHGANAKSSPLPNGNYDIFIIPPHSAGSGFLYLPSLKPNINSFIAGFCSALLAVGIYNILVPALSQTLASLNSGIGILLCLAAVGAAFSFGRTSTESAFPSSSGPGSGSGPNFTYTSSANATPPRSGPAPRTSPGGTTYTSPPRPNGTAQSSWEKAKEQTRQRAEERKKADDLKARQEEAARKAAEAEKAAKAAAEKERWEQQRAREKDARERLAREKIAKDRAARDAANKAGAGSAGPRKYEKPTAQSVGTDSDYFSHFKPPFASDGASSVSGRSESSYAASMSTARTTPPPKNRGPYKTDDVNKVVLLGVYTFTNAFGLKPTSMLEKDRGGVSDGLILRIATEGLFIDDDVRGVGQREWDVKAWSLKLLEIGRIDDICVFRATPRDAEGKRYVFVLMSGEQWKVDTGLQRLRKGSQVRALGLSTMPDKEVKAILMSLGWK
ncbi:hypothetical protein KVT40_002334 [Elsinoe batatas]|uniref:Uncharacterized protein n=1 Tax=Elsinoe batatas TaxID=2601811 RepID=A0A8K0LAW0_9PEZI|nr:hypothetical protein KVT40_002334 [Elsinoe batatas]